MESGSPPRFREDSDIDIAIIGVVNYYDLLKIQRILYEKLNRAIDLVYIDELSKVMQLQIVSSNRRLIFRDNIEVEKFLRELNNWYKEDYPFWLKMQKEKGYLT